MKTSERITEEALKLFSEFGYKGTSVKQIADAVGIKDASLYKHYKSKQDIFQSIVELIRNHISELSTKLELPEESDVRSGTTFSERIDETFLKKVTREAFLFYLTDPYISKFWRIAHMEQYQNEEIYTMFRQIFIEDAITYQTMFFERMAANGFIVTENPEAAAISYYAPIFLLLTKYENQLDRKEEALDLLDKQVGEFLRIYRKGKI